MNGPKSSRFCDDGLDAYYLNKYLDANKNKACDNSNDSDSGTSCTNSYLEDDLLNCHGLDSVLPVNKATVKIEEPVKCEDKRYFKYIRSYVILQNCCRIIKETELITVTKEQKQIEQVDTVCVLEPPKDPLNFCPPPPLPKGPLRYNNTRTLNGLIYCLPEEFTTKTVGCENNRLIVELDRRYQNVKIVKLVTSIVPYYDTIINCFNNQISFQLQDDCDRLINSSGNDKWNISLPVGNYSIETLLERMIKLMNASVMEIVCECEGAQIKVENPFYYEFDQLTGSIAIKTQEPYTFKLAFGDGDTENCRCLYRMLGFCNFEQDIFVDCWENDGHIDLCLDEFVLMRSNTSQELNTVYDCNTKGYYFNILNLRPWDNYEKIYEKRYSKAVLQDSHLTYLESIIDNSDLHFDCLDFSFFNELGQPISLERLDPKFVIQIVEYSDRLVGQNLNTRRGVVDYTSVVDHRIDTLKNAF